MRMHRWPYGPGFKYFKNRERANWKGKKCLAVIIGNPPVKGQMIRFESYLNVQMARLKCQPLDN